MLAVRVLAVSIRPMLLPQSPTKDPAIEALGHFRVNYKTTCTASVRLTLFVVEVTSFLAEEWIAPMLRYLRWIFLALAFGISVQLARGQSSCPAPVPYALLPQNNYYGYLRNPVCRSDFWDPVKFIALNAEGEKYLTFGGEIREWYEGFRNANYGIGPQDDNGFLLQRITLYSDWHIGDRFRFFGQLTSDIEAGRNGGPQPYDEDRLWVEQGFLDIKAIDSHDVKLTLRAGRQEFEFGIGRLVDVREGLNVRLAFDGINLILDGHSWHLDGFATRPVINNLNVFDNPPDHSIMFWGVYAVRPLPATRGGHIDLYYLGIDKKRATFDRGSAQEVRHTAGTRFWGSRSALDYDWETMYQWGTFGNADIRAWGIGTDTAYNLRSVFLRPQLSVRATLTSGDRNPPSGPLGTLNPLFPTGIYFGEGAVNLNGPSNLMRIGLGIKLHLTDTVLLAADYDPFWRTSLQDGVYGLGVNLLRSGAVNQNRYIGSQASTGIYWQADRHLSISAAYTHFFVGPFFTQGASPGRNVDNAAIWTTYKF